MDYGRFFDLSLDLLAVAGTDGFFRHLNQGWTEVLGWSAAEMLAVPYVDLVHPDDRADTIREAGNLATGGRSIRFENRYRHRDGGYVWLQWNAMVSPTDGLIYCIARDVTKAKRIWTNLREIETNTRVGAWEIDLETNDLYWSEATHRIHGTDPATFKPKLADGLSFYAPDAILPMTAAVDGLMRNGTAYSLELPFITAQGRHIWVRAMARAEMLGGKPVRVFGTFEDITREREERQRLLAFKDIVDLASDGICVTDAVGRATYANTRMSRLLGLEDGALVGRALADFVAPGWETAILGLTAPVMGVGEHRQDFQMRRADGTLIWVSASIRVRTAADGRPQSTIALVRDITERKRIEMELEANRIRLEEAQVIARLGHWDANMATGDLFWSDVIYEIFGLDKATVTPSIDVFNAALHPDDVAKVRNSEVRARDTGVHDVEHRIIRPDGEVRWVRELASLRTDAEGRLTRLVGTVQDITRQKEVEQALEAARAMAESANRAKSAFLATMSHELRTPLNAILGFSEIIRDGTFGTVHPPIYGEYAGHVHDSAAHLLEIINDVLDLAKIEAAAISYAPVRLVLTEKVGRAIQTIAPMAKQRDVRMVVHGGAGIHVLADRRATLQALFNILSNAVRFSPEGGQVEVDIGCEGDFALVAVRDHGPGFSPDVLQELGQPFPGQSDSYRSSARSTGLGFSITAALLKGQKGDIVARNNPDGGATVTIRLPLYRDPEATGAIPPAA